MHNLLFAFIPLSLADIVSAIDSGSTDLESLGEDELVALVLEEQEGETSTDLMEDLGADTSGKSNVTLSLLGEDDTAMVALMDIVRKFHVSHAEKAIDKLKFLHGLLTPKKSPIMKHVKDMKHLEGFLLDIDKKFGLSGIVDLYTDGLKLLDKIPDPLDAKIHTLEAIHQLVLTHPSLHKKATALAFTVFHVLKLALVSNASLKGPLGFITLPTLLALHKKGAALDKVLPDPFDPFKHIGFFDKAGAFKPITELLGLLPSVSLPSF